MPTTPLQGVRVLDLTHYVAGPYCTKLLAAYGADVIKIERPPAGDPARRQGPFVHDTPHPEGSALFLHLNTDKRSVTLNLKTAEGREIFRRLVPTVQIVVENFRPGVLDRLGFGYDTLAALNPAIVLTSISNFGQTGPYRDLQASELIESAMGGPMNITGHVSREPLKLGGNIAQHHAGAMAAYATMTALWGAEADGEGDWIDVSIYETQVSSRDRRVIWLLAHAYTGETGKRQAGNQRALNGFMPARDGYVNLTGGGSRLPGLLRMIEREDLLEEERFRDREWRSSPEAADEVEPLLLDWLQRHSMYEAVERAQRFHVLAAPVNTVAGLFADPHFQARSPWRVVVHPQTGPVRYPGPPFSLSDAPAPSMRRAPLLGEHTAELLCDELGYPREDLPRLAEQGVI